MYLSHGGQGAQGPGMQQSWERLGHRRGLQGVPDICLNTQMAPESGAGRIGTALARAG